MEKPSSDTYSEAETIARREAALKYALTTPPKPHQAMRKGRKVSKLSLPLEAVFEEVSGEFATVFADAGLDLPESADFLAACGAKNGVVVLNITLP